ncbi:MAG: hypothetical protein HYS13_01025 [Planctomycetia bacterium]|nr:hypothetical protein [Planctomycetia bacterium]
MSVRKLAMFAAAVFIAVGIAWGQEPQAKDPSRLDLRKRVIEFPVEKAIVGRTAPAGENAGAPNAAPPATPMPGATAGAPPAAPAAAAPPQRADRGKSLIEFPVKNAVAGRTAPPGAEPAPPANSPPATATHRDNPKVEPGKVKWHADFAAAREAAKESGKPVLLFHMLGNLDDKFC